MVSCLLLFAPLSLRRGQLLLIQIAIGLRRQIERELVVTGVLVRRCDLDVVQRHDARQRGDSTDELRQLVIAAGEPDFDRQLRVEILLLLRAWLEELLFESRRKSRLRNIDEKIRHLGLAGQLAQESSEGALNVLQLLLVDFKVDRFGMFVLKLGAQGLLLTLRLVELRAFRLPHPDVSKYEGDDKEPYD